MSTLSPHEGRNRYQFNERQILWGCFHRPDNWHKVTTVLNNNPTFDEISFIQVRAATMSWGHNNKDTVLVVRGCQFIAGEQVVHCSGRFTEVPAGRLGHVYIQGHTASFTLVGWHSDIPFCSYFDK
ncbi:MAG: hypothetical protein MJE68_16915 [Proteobacteria bacterium]|nr:hypothetical protein [Pseudomonadota bacterium]